MTLPDAKALFKNRPGKTARIPTDLEALFGFSADCECGRTHQVDLKHAKIRRGATEDILPIAKEVGKNLKIGVIADRVTWEIAGHTLAGLLKSDGHEIRRLIVPDGAGNRPHADEKRLRIVEEALSGHDLAVAVGAGTINDLTKLASFNLGIPYIAAATAPSMNGYTSAIAALLIRGVKRTINCHQAFAVIADLDVLVRSPKALIRAGLGDLMSKPTASADFRLAGMLRGAYYCPAPEQVALSAEQRAADLAAALGEGDPDAVGALIEALILSGISMKLADSSSTASGGEHLISHFFDMTAAADNRVEGWHGAQVGVATIVTATLYQRLRETRPADIDIETIIASRPSRQDQELMIGKFHGPFSEEVKSEWFSKQLDDGTLADELLLIKNNWHALWHDLDSVLCRPERIRNILAASGAPTTVSALGLTQRNLETAFAAAPQIRNRFTVLDFAYDLGLFDTIAPLVLKSSGCLE